MAAHERPRTTKLFDRTADIITLDEVERIVILANGPPPLTDLDENRATPPQRFKIPECAASKMLASASSPRM